MYMYMYIYIYIYIYLSIFKYSHLYILGIGRGIFLWNLIQISEFERNSRNAYEIRQKLPNVKKIPEIKSSVKKTNEVVLFFDLL